MTDYTYTFVTYPGAISTRPTGINNSGEIVGYYTDQSNINHGFIDNAGVYTSYDVPGSISTQIEGVSATGTLVGFYYNPAVDLVAQEHGFVSTGGVTTTIDYPDTGATTVPNGVNTANQVVGTYSVGASQHGFFYSGGSFQALNYPNATGTYVQGINDAGDVAGTYSDANFADHGFFTQNGALTSVDPSSSVYTNVSGMNNLYQVAGSYRDASGTVHGFTDANGVVSTFDVTSGQPTITGGINDLGQVVGYTQDSNGTNAVGFVATPLCFGAGTLLATARGPVQVDDLQIGDLAATVGGTLRPIVWIGHRRVDCRGRAEACPIRVSADAFGVGVPIRDLYLSPGHPVLVGAEEDGEGGHLVPVMCLINGTTIARTTVEEITYWHVELDHHDILLAEGLAAESYIDLGSRLWFDGATGALFDPDMALLGMPGRCRPVATDGPVVKAEQRRLDRVFAMRLAAASAWPGDQDALSALV